MRSDVFRSLTNSAEFAGIFAVQMRDVRSLPPAEVAIASILAAGLWALQTRSRRRAELHIKTASRSCTFVRIRSRGFCGLSVVRSPFPRHACPPANGAPPRVRYHSAAPYGPSARLPARALPP